MCASLSTIAFSKKRKKKEKITGMNIYNAILSPAVTKSKLGSPYIITSSPALICNSGTKFKSSFKVFLLAGTRVSNVYKCFSILQNCADLLYGLILETGLKLPLHYENSMSHIIIAKLENSHSLTEFVVKVYFQFSGKAKS